jgi:DNA helicase II / ATP-dependent DNA helicase PcrA
MTAHGSKGLEFDTVYVLSAVKSIWDSRGRSNHISLLPHLKNIDHPQNQDDALRLFYVAMTRAKRQLIIATHELNEDGKPQVPFSALLHHDVTSRLPTPDEPISLTTTDAGLRSSVEHAWHDQHISVPQQSMQKLLAQRLETYRLSATHLGTFLDVTNGGPHAFLLGNLLRFPSAMSPSASYGDAIHKTLEYLHSHIIEHATAPDGDKLINYFKSALELKHLSELDHQRYLQQGETALSIFLRDYAPSISANHKPEVSFYDQGVVIGEAHLTGKLDVLEVRKNQARVTDYKTGKYLRSWEPSRTSPFDKIKQFKYRQQLLFYKLLVDNARSYGGRGVRATEGVIFFVEPDDKGQLRQLDLSLDDQAAVDELSALIQIVWRHIMELNLPDTSHYSPDIKGIEQFKQDLLDGKI